jgi:hypothetical protein
MTPSETSTQGPTDTPGAPVEGTFTITPTETPLLSFPAFTATATLLGAASAIPSFTPVTSGGVAPTNSGPLCKKATFEGESVPDHTTMKPGEAFTKIWKIRNTGICTWDEGFSFAAYADNAPTLGTGLAPYVFRFEKDFIEPNEAVSIAIEMVAPNKACAPNPPGDCIAHWSMYDDEGTGFGDDYTVVINIVP